MCIEVTERLFFHARSISDQLFDSLNADANSDSHIHHPEDEKTAARPRLEDEETEDVDSGPEGASSASNAVDETSSSSPVHHSTLAQEDAMAAGARTEEEFRSSYASETYGPSSSSTSSSSSPSSSTSSSSSPSSSPSSSSSSSAPPASTFPITSYDSADGLRYALENATLDETGRILNLRLPIPVLGHRSSIFIRDVYRGCFEGVLCQFDASRARNRSFVVLGTPGSTSRNSLAILVQPDSSPIMGPSRRPPRRIAVGKSAFGLYLVHQALRLGRTVVYSHQMSRSTIILRNNGTSAELPLDGARPREITDPNTVYICDGCTPIVASAFTVLLTSPDRSVWYKFRTQVGAPILTFPTVSRDEMLQIAHACFPEVDDATVNARYNLWGGVTRFVLQIDDDGSFAGALQRLNLSSSLSLFEAGLETDERISHRIIHFQCAGEALGSTLPVTSPDFYKFNGHVFASAEAQRRFFAARLRWESASVLEFLLNPALTSASQRAMYVSLFEDFVLELLPLGGRFRFRELTLTGDGAEGVLDLPAATTVSRFRTVGDLAELGGGGGLATSVFTPEARNFTPLDVLFFGRIGNVTIDKAHALLMRNVAGTEGAFTVAQALQLPNPFPFFWIVPARLFPSWRKPLRVVPAEEAVLVQQFVLAVDVEADFRRVLPGRTERPE